MTGLGPTRLPPTPPPRDGPYIPASATVAEVTVKAVVIGILLAVILGAANTYLGLKAGLTVSASIPAAVVSLAVLRWFRRHSILENNMVQTIASAGEAVAGGMLFTIPALLIMRVWDPVTEGVHYWETTIIGVVGGLLGVFFTVPLRRALIVEENLAFPEGVATAEVLKSGESAGSGVGALLLGGALGAAYTLLGTAMNLWQGTAATFVRAGKAVTGVATQLSAALLGVGYIVGARIATIIFAGSVFTWLVAIPLLSMYGDGAAMASTVSSTNPATAGCHGVIADLASASAANAASCLYKYQARYLGVGAMLVGGLYSLYKLRGPLLRAVTKGIGGSRRAGAGDAEVPRTEVELSPLVTFGGVGLLLVPMVVFYAYVTQWNWAVAAVMGLIMLVTGFLFSAVGAYMAGIVGSSNNPISGVTILTLMVAAGTLKLFGLAPDVGAEATIFVAAVIAIAGSMASDNLQDLKAGHMLGATPRKQQAMLAIGAVVSAFVLAPVLNVLIAGPPNSDQAKTLANAPQSNLMASIAQGIFNPEQGLPYLLIALGGLLAVGLAVLDQTAGRRNPKFRIPIMAVAVGMYLPIDTTAPIFLGGLVAWVTAKVHRARTGRDLAEGSNPGVLFASGLIAGEALLGILRAGLTGVAGPKPGLPWVDYGGGPYNLGQFLWLGNAQLASPGFVLLAYLAFLMGYMALRKATRAPANGHA